MHFVIVKLLKLQFFDYIVFPEAVGYQWERAGVFSIWADSNKLEMYDYSLWA